MSAHQENGHATPCVSILLGTFNGERFLPEQLDSISDQKYQNWSLYVSDDGSSDSTIDILNRFKAQNRQKTVHILAGPKKGFAANFLHLVRAVNIKDGLFAYADQDDIWKTNKLERAVEWFNTIPNDIPSLYCGRTSLIDENGHNLGFSPLFQKPPCFRNALVQSIAGGNTMVFNSAARNLLCQSSYELPIVTHDWWTYLVVSGCGGMVKYDSYPTVLYRQHNSNLVGMNNGMKAKIRRLKMLYEGRFQQWNSNNVMALKSIQPLLTEENRDVVERFSRARKLWLIPRLANLKRAGVFRQTALGNFSLVAAAALGKV